MFLIRIKIKNLKKLVLTITIISLSVLFSACVQKPTKVYESQKFNNKHLVKAARKPIVIDENTKILDVRSSFDYTMAHLPGSYNMQWTEFSDQTAPHPGFLKKDLKREAQRLALRGIHPRSKVVIVGKGKNGNGEEGRLAWTLMTLGFNKVQFASMENFKMRMANSATPPPKNTKLWQPKVLDSLFISTKEIKAVLKKPLNQRRARGQRVVIIDVRNEKEYIKSGAETTDINALNIPWKEFITSKGRPNWKMRSRLIEYGVGKNDTIILISNQGIRSAAATSTLLSLGFNNATNAHEGFSQLFKRKSFW